MGEKGKEQFRLERDAEGEEQIAIGNYYGIETARLKKEWFWVGAKTSSHIFKAYIKLKQAYAQAHAKLLKLDEKTAVAIDKACEEMLLPNNVDQFIAESLQSISGTTINTNVNEVLANRAEELLGGKIGEHKLVQIQKTINLNQENNALFLLATKIAVMCALNDLEPEILNLERLLRRDALTLAKVLKVSAMPNTQSTTGQWGKRLNVFTTELEIAIKRIKESENNLLHDKNANQESFSQINEASDEQNEINKLMLQNLAHLTGFQFKEEDLQVASNGQSEFVISDLVLVSAALKDLATVLSKVAGVSKMAHTSPQQLDTANIALPSKIQIYADSLHMAAYQVVSNNFSFTFLAQCEQLESVMLMPLLSHNLLSTIELLQTLVVGFQRKGLL
jgi:aspartate ammonia-lyase